MSKIASEQSMRPKIFENWPKNPTKLYQGSTQQKYRQSKKKQSLRSQQILNKSLMILSNIKHFLYTKKQIKQQYNTHYDKSQNCRKNLQDLTMQNGKQFEMLKYQSSIRDYYFIIRQQSIFLRQAQGFVLVNLANYDKKLTEIRFSQDKKSDDYLKQLQIKIQDIQQKRTKLQQALVMYEQGIQPSLILSNQYQLENALDNLNQSLSNQKLTQLHYLMLYQVKEINQDLKKFQKNVNDDKENYATYQALCDSMNLMEYQRQQMKKDRKNLQTNFEKLTSITAPSIVPATHQSLPILIKNQALYESNRDLLARYNAETNLNEYASRRKKYLSQFGKYKQQLVRWKQKQKVSSYLYSKQQILDSYENTQVMKNKNGSKKQKQQLKQAYLDALYCQVPLGEKPIQKYKIYLLKKFGVFMNSNGIVVPEGTQILVSNMNINQNQSKLFQKCFDFFMQLNQQPIKNKVSFLLQKKNNINALLYQLSENQNKDKNNQTNPKLKEQYETGLDYCAAIAQHSTNFSDNQYIQKTQEMRKRNWSRLPMGLNSLLFHYTCDVNIKNEFEKYITDKFEPRMKKIQQDIYNQLKNSGKQKQLTQIPQLKFNLNQEERRQFFFCYLHKLSDYSSILKQKLLEKYWKTVSSHIINAYIKQKQQKKNETKGISEVSKSDFFTFKILSYLSVSGTDLKINNFPDTIDYYLDYLNKYQYYRLDQKQKFQQIVKQRIFMEFIQCKIQYNHLNLYQQFIVMKKLNQACILLYQINDNALFANKQDINNHFQYCIKLQHAQNDLLANLPPENSSFLVVKMKNLVKGMRKDPIITGSHLNIDDLQLLVNTDSKLKKFERLITFSPDFGFISLTYILCQNALKTIQNFNEQVFTKSDIISLNDKSKSLYLVQLQKKSKDQLMVLKPQFNEIMNIYQFGNDKEGQNKQVQIKQTKFKSKWENQLHQIIKKLYNML